jgi:hypothetical protein
MPTSIHPLMQIVRNCCSETATIPKSEIQNPKSANIFSEIHQRLFLFINLIR